MESKEIQVKHRQGGRPRVFTTKKKKEFLKALEQRATFSGACRDIGCTQTTLLNEWNRGEKGAKFKQKCYETLDFARRNKAAVIKDKLMEATDELIEKCKDKSTDAELNAMEINQLSNAVSKLEPAEPKQPTETTSIRGVLTDKGIAIEFINKQASQSRQVEEPEDYEDECEGNVIEGVAKTSVYETSQKNSNTLGGLIEQSENKNQEGV